MHEKWNESKNSHNDDISATNTFPQPQCWFSKVTGVPLVCFLLLAERLASSDFSHYTCQWDSTARAVVLWGSWVLPFARQNASTTQVLLCHLKTFRVCKRRDFNLCNAIRVQLLGGKLFFDASCFKVYGWLINSVTEKIFKQQLFPLPPETWSYRPCISARGENTVYARALGQGTNSSYRKTPSHLTPKRW